ncbi:PilN domain-containing protein [Methylocaldum szegediense]|uniref:General secretion pathway protein L n=1 Tax=Methylocaldum szegediense TaxID=73780 RepID=A0ABN8X5E8_9GAMM|nr:PilN domain-containing protein [Methylocaldum szegediense]CAI8834887.1 general secretion pathway protein L [Methylocaldum szegediense]
MLKLDTPINLDVDRFFRWWGNELSFLVPAPLKKLLGTTDEYLIVTKDDDGLNVVYRNDEGDRPLGYFSLDDSGSQKRERLLESMPELAEAKTILRLTTSQALRKTLKLPLAAEENLAQVVAFEMDRLTPFKSDQVYYAARLLERLPANRQIKVELVLTPRNKLDALLDELAVWGWRPDLVDVVGNAPLGAYDLLPETYRPPKNPWPHRINLALTTVIVLLVVTLAVLPIWTNRSLALELEQEVRKVSKTAKEVEALRQQVEDLVHQTRFLQQKKRTEPAMVDILKELTDVMPDQTWLNGLQYRDHRLVIQGQSPSASALIGLIEASPFFRNTSFVSPVTRDMVSGLERFQIASEVVNGRFSEKPASSN